MSFNLCENFVKYEVLPLTENNSHPKFNIKKPWFLQLFPSKDHQSPHNLHAMDKINDHVQNPDWGWQMKHLPKFNIWAKLKDWSHMRYCLCPKLFSQETVSNLSREWGHIDRHKEANWWQDGTRQVTHPFIPFVRVRNWPSDRVMSVDCVQSRWDKGKRHAWEFFHAWSLSAVPQQSLNAKILYDNDHLNDWYVN